jgi:hypothetical protein
VSGALLFALSPHRWADPGLLAFTLGNAYLWCAALVLWSAAKRPVGRVREPVGATDC